MHELEHLPIHLIERHLADATSESERLELEGHLQGCAQCRARLAEAVEARQAFLQRNPPEIRARQAVAAAALAPRIFALPWVRIGLPSLASVGALAAVLMVVSHPDAPATAPGALGVAGPNAAEGGAERPAILSKGAAGVTAFVQGASGDRPRPLSDATRVAAGDRIQLVIRPAADKSHVAVYGMDRSGALARLFAYDASTAKTPPPALRVDDAPGPERLFVVMSAVDVPSAAVVQAARAALGPDATEGVAALSTFVIPGHADAQVESLLIRKKIGTPPKHESEP
jgi:hypothetical protein